MSIIDFAQSNWKNKTYDEKLRLINNLEKKFANIENRKVREIIITTDKDHVAKEAAAQYNYELADFLFVKDISEGMDIYSSIIHEGLHAMIDDGYNARIKYISVYSDIDIDEFSKQRGRINILYNHFYYKKILPLFHLKYAEEDLVHTETKIHMLNEFYNVCDSSQLKIKYFFEIYEPIFSKEYSRQKFIEKINDESGTSFEKEMSNIVVNKEKLLNYKKIPKVKKLNKKILKNYYKQLELYLKLAKVKSERQKSKIIKQFQLNLMRY